MPDATFLPYKTAPDSLAVNIVGVSIDGESRDIGEIVDHSAYQIQLSGVDNWVRTNLEIEVSDPNAELPPVLSHEESVDDAIDVYVTLKGGKGRARSGLKLTPSGKSAWSGNIQIVRDNELGSLDLEAVAVRRTRGEPEIGLASWVGERVAWSKRWMTYIDDKPLMPGGAISGEWRDFENDDSEELRQRSDCAWYLNLSDPDKPKLYLNEGIDRLKGALEAPAVRGRPAAVRDVIAQSILQSALIALCVEAISGADEPQVEDLDGWRKSLLVAMGKLADASQSPELVVEGWLEAWQQDSKNVIAGITTAVQRHLEMPATATRLVRATES
jgi:hypothetical protein